MDLAGAMDFTMGWLLMSSLVSTIGLALFVYGKKQLRTPQLLTGIALMVFPYFVAGAGWMAGIACLLLAAMQLALRAGM
jgi:hypothetical protein